MAAWRLMGNATSTILGQDAGRGFMTGAGVVASVQTLRGVRSNWVPIG